MLILQPYKRPLNSLDGFIAAELQNLEGSMVSLYLYHIFFAEYFMTCIIFALHQAALLHKFYDINLVKGVVNVCVLITNRHYRYLVQMLSYKGVCCVCRTTLSAHMMNAVEWILPIGDFASVVG